MKLNLNKRKIHMLFLKKMKIWSGILVDAIPMLLSIKITFYFITLMDHEIWSESLQFPIGMFGTLVIVPILLALSLGLIIVHKFFNWNQTRVEKNYLNKFIDQKQFYQFILSHPHTKIPKEKILQVTKDNLFYTDTYFIKEKMNDNIVTINKFYIHSSTNKFEITNDNYKEVTFNLNYNQELVKWYEWHFKNYTEFKIMKQYDVQNQLNFFKTNYDILNYDQQDSKTKKCTTKNFEFKETTYSHL